MEATRVLLSLALAVWPLAVSGAAPAPAPATTPPAPPATAPAPTTAPAPLSVVTASSTHDGPYEPELAIDGDPQTRWASQANTNRPQWLQLDLGAATTIDKLAITWEAAFAVEYEVQLSDNSKDWKTVARKTDGKGRREVLSLRASVPAATAPAARAPAAPTPATSAPAATAPATSVARGRHLRILCLKPGPHPLYSIWEVEFPDSQLGDALRQRQRLAEQERRRIAIEGRKRSIETLGALGVQELVFAARRVVGEHWYANFGYYAYGVGPDRRDTVPLYRDGGKLYRYDVPTGKFTALLDDPRGGVRDPQVDYTGRKILFSYRKGGTPYYHLYEINADGSDLKQLTDGPYDDIEPTYLPDGGIIFVSSRARRWVNCWLTQVAILYRCEADGSNPRMLSSNNEHDNTPWVLPDGRVLYTRWEYVDRSQVDFHHLWVMNPDGTGQTVFYGNMHPMGGALMADAKPIPGVPGVLGAEKVVATFGGGHGRTEHMGFITVVDPRRGPDELSSAKRLTRGADFRDPWAFSEDCFLAALGATLVLVNGQGEAQEVTALPEADIRAGMLLHEPRPLAPRPREPVIPVRTSPAQPGGTMLLANVYEGRSMAGVKPGEIKKLLVLETLPKPINFTGGMEPLSYGGTFTLERILGTVPVEDDGSAYFEVPALRSVFFVALDENDLSVKRMQSFATVQPGETLGCVGCHEPRVQVPPAAARRPAALNRPPRRIQPITDVPDVIDFPRDIQPILDRHCVPCHDYDKFSGGLILTGDRGPMFSHSYFSLTARNQVSDGRNRPRGNYPPRALGSAASPLVKRLKGAPAGVPVTALERKTVRLWIDSGAAYPGTYAALGSGMIGGYAQNNLDRSALDWPSTKAAVEAIARRCASCHTGDRALPTSVCDDSPRPPWVDMGPNDPRRRYSRHLLYNLTRPEKSLLLLAPLATEAGGYGLCRALPPATQPGTQPAGTLAGTAHTASPTAAPAATRPAATQPAGTPFPVFTSTTDPDYVRLLAAIDDARKKLDEIKRFDMPGFRPRVEWVREMKRFGILPEALSPEEPIDCYAVERRYWQSLWHQPTAPR